MHFVRSEVNNIIGKCAIFHSPIYFFYRTCTNKVIKITNFVIVVMTLESGEKKRIIFRFLVLKIVILNYGADVSGSKYDVKAKKTSNNSK